MHGTHVNRHHPSARHKEIISSGKMRAREMHEKESQQCVTRNQYAIFVLSLSHPAFCPTFCHLLSRGKAVLFTPGHILCVKYYRDEKNELSVLMKSV